ncbi:MAG: hypothetical protein RR705_03885 [Lachnospiraceae bacterium]
MEEKSSKLGLQLAYGYLLLPFLIFVIGWVKVYLAIPIVLIVFFCFLKACKDTSKVWVPKITKENLGVLLFIIGICALWVYFSGIGKFVFQNADHTVRNTIFNLLVERDWPIINYEILKSELPKTSATGLVYYIGFWLPSAIIGKMFGLRIGYYSQALWALFGILLIYYFICSISKKIEVWPLIILIFFSGLDILGHYLIGTDMSDIGRTLHLEWWDTPYQFSGMTTQLFWVFNQAVPAWLCTILIYVQKNNRTIVFILACSMLSSTFPFIGLLLIAAFFACTRNYQLTGQEDHKVNRCKQHMQLFLRDTFTLQNVVGGGIIGIVSYLYLSSNIAGDQVMETSSRGIMWEPSLVKWILFFVIEVGIYMMLIYKYEKKNLLFYFIVLNLVVLSLIKVGTSNDFCMRASIPALFILMLMVIDAVRQSWGLKDYKTFIALMIALSIGGVTSLHEFTRTTTETITRINNNQIVYAEDADEVEVLNSSNFVGNVHDNFFFEYLAK